MGRRGTLSLALVGGCPERVRILADTLALGLAEHGCRCVMAADGDDADLVLRLDGGDALTAKIALWRSGEPMPAADPSLLAIIADRPLAGARVPVIDPYDPATLAAFVAGWRAGIGALAGAGRALH